jgi:hypothetical protein
MEQREIDFIGQDLYQRTLKAKEEGKWTKHDIELEQELFNELNLLDIEHYYWHMQVGAAGFNAKHNDTVVPILLRYIDKFDGRGLNQHFLSCLNVRGFYNATEFLLDKYKKSKGLPYKSEYESISNALRTIRDPRYIKDYLEIINWDQLRTETSNIADLLASLKVKEAVPRIIELLDYTSPEAKYLYAFLIRPLSKYKDSNHIKYITKYLNDEDSYIRDLTFKSIKRMGGIIEKTKNAKRKTEYILISPKL